MTLWKLKILKIQTLPNHQNYLNDQYRNSDNNPEKELLPDKSIADDKTKQISKKNTTQNKKITPKNDKSNKSFDEISNEIFRDLVSKKDSLVKEIKELETKKDELEKDIDSNFKGQSDNIAKRVKGFQEYLTGALQNLSQNVEKLELVSQPIIVKPSPVSYTHLTLPTTCTV